MSSLLTRPFIARFLAAFDPPTARNEIGAAAQADLLALQNQVNHVPIVIDSFTVTPSVAQKGASVSPIFNWTRNVEPPTLVSQSISPTVGSVPVNQTSVSPAISVTSNTTFTLTLSDGTSLPGSTAQKTASIQFQSKSYWGPTASATLTSSQVIALGNSTFTTSRARKYTITANNQYPTIAWPKSQGLATGFKVNGFNSTLDAWTRQADLAVLNESGYTEDYYVYRMNSVQLGTFEIEVL